FFELIRLPVGRGLLTGSSSLFGFEPRNVAINAAAEVQRGFAYLLLGGPGPQIKLVPGSVSSRNWTRQRVACQAFSPFSVSVVRSTKGLRFALRRTPGVPAFRFTFTERQVGDATSIGSGGGLGGGQRGGGPGGSAGAGACGRRQGDQGNGT